MSAESLANVSSYSQWRTDIPSLPWEKIDSVVICYQSCLVLEIIQITLIQQHFTKGLLHVKLISTVDNFKY